MTLTLTLTASIAGRAQSDGDLTSVAADINNIRKISYRTGSGANQANQFFSDRRTLAASTSEDLDLSGALTDAFGASIAFTKVKAIQVTAPTTNTNDVVIGGAAANAFVGPFGASTHKVSVPPGGVVTLANPTAAGWTVTAATGDLLKIANSAAGSSVDYEIVIVGA